MKEREGERGENDGAHCSSCMTIISHLQPRHDVLHENVAAGLNGWVMEHHRNAWKKDEDHSWWKYYGNYIIFVSIDARCSSFSYILAAKLACMSCPMPNDFCAFWANWHTQTHATRARITNPPHLWSIAWASHGVYYPKGAHTNTAKLLLLVGKPLRPLWSSCIISLGAAAIASLVSSKYILPLACTVVPGHGAGPCMRWYNKKDRNRMTTVDYSACMRLSVVYCLLHMHSIVACICLCVCSKRAKKKSVLYEIVFAKTIVFSFSSLREPVFCEYTHGQQTFTSAFERCYFADWRACIASGFLHATSNIYTLIADCRVLSKLLLLLLYHRTSRAIRTSYSNWTHKRLAITECFHWFKQKMLCTFDLHLKTTKKLCFSSHFLLLLCITSRPQKWRKKRGSDSSINWWISVLYTVNCIPTWTQSIRTNGAKR